jgi:hypothetical protein
MRSCAGTVSWEKSDQRDWARNREMSLCRYTLTVTLYMVAGLFQAHMKLAATGCKFAGVGK